MSIWIKRVHNQLTAADFLVEESVMLEVNADTLAQSDLSSAISAVYEQLGGQGSWSEIPMLPIDLWATPTYLMVDVARSFNRYRLMTLNAPIYLELKFFDLSSFKRYCRQFESECKKGGVKKGRWTSPLAEAHFGKSSDPGDFFQVGSAGWRLYAFQQFLTDMAAHHQKLRLRRFSIYRNLLMSGVLARMDKLMLSDNPANLENVQKVLKRLVAE